MATLNLGDAATKYVGLVGDCGYNAASRGAVLFVIHGAREGGLEEVSTRFLRSKIRKTYFIIRIYPVPLVREAALGSVSVRVSPRGSSSYRSFILRLKNVPQYFDGVWSEKGLRHESDLVVNVGIPC